jgi:hypothetical protein
MSKVFLSYRRTDAHPDVAKVVDGLKRAHGPQSFVDAPPIRAVGSAYRTLVENAMRECIGTAVIAGPEIDTAPDALGKRRLDNPDDPLRIEIESALKIHKMMVVVALVGGADLSEANTLPPPLRPLTRRGVMRMGVAESFDADSGYLNAAVGRMLNGTAQRSVRLIMVLFIIITAVSLLFMVLATVQANTGGL